ncbi:MAG: glycosyltransferase family 4 protein [bacterium]|nr:glycosyltransferase family 4 protein [bacterium]MDO8581578.1 glycosyltransferase family 4 protein [bacterium]
MRIAHLVSTFPPYYGGMGNAVFGMAQESAKRGHEVTVLTAKQESGIRNKGDRSIIPNSLFIIRRLRSFGRWGNAAFLPQLFWMLDDYDIVHLHYPFFGGAEAAALWRASQLKRGRQLVVTYHMDAIADGWLGRVFAWHNRFILPSILSLADRIIVTSFDYAEHSLLKQYESRVKNKMVEIPLGVDTERFTPREKDAELLRQHKIDPASFTLLFVGGLDRAHAFKGVEVLIRSFKLFSEFQHVDDRRAHTLVIVGDGALRPSYAALALELGIQDKIVFTGRVAPDDLPRYYATADCVVLPSINQSEAFGMTILEAMACGRPVIASLLPGVRKLVLDRRTGLFAKPSDIVGLAKVIAVIADDPELRVRYGNAGRERALDRYTWSAVGEELERVYR